MTISVHSAIESPDDAAGNVLRAVATARRRVRTVSMLRLAAIAAPAGVTIGATLALAGWAPAWMAGALGLLGAAGATAWAAARTPPPAAVARLLDARLGLRDRVAAAVQLQPTDGPIAALVARDAAARLAPVRMTAVFPLAMGRVPALTVAVAVASVAWLASSDRADRLAELPVQSAASEPAGASADSPARGNSRGTAPTSESRASGQRSTPRAAEPPAVNGRSDGRDAFAPATATLGPRAVPPPADATSVASASAPGGSRQAASAPAAAGITGRTGRGGAGAGTAGGGLRSGAGGAAPGNALADAGGDAAAPTQAASWRAARASAEAALARDVIPPDYRDHVRAYFRTLPAPSTGARGTR